MVGSTGSTLHAAWTGCEQLDSETIARIALGMGPFLQGLKIRDPACISGIVLDATEVFQLLHFSFDEIYWDTRAYPKAVADFIAALIDAMRLEPDWINERYVTGRESLADYLRRHPVDREA